MWGRQVVRQVFIREALSTLEAAFPLQVRDVRPAGARAWRAQTI